MTTTETFSEQLRVGCEANWQAATSHRFVAELANDEISDADYVRYLILDYAFLDILVAHVGQAVTTAPSMVEKRQYAGFLGVLTGDEDDYFLRSFAAMGVAEADWRQPYDHAVVRGFHEIMLGGERPHTPMCWRRYCRWSGFISAGPNRSPITRRRAFI